MLSGVSNSGGPNGFFDVESEYSKREKTKIASRLAGKLSDISNPELPPEQELVDILVQALTDLGDWDTGIYINHDRRWCREVVVVGTVTNLASYQDVTGIRVCRYGDEYGGFDEMLGSDGEWISELTQMFEADVVFMDQQFQGTTINEASIERASFKTLQQAISQGLRGEDLRSALLDDFHMWMFEGPDSWPSRDESLGPPLFAEISGNHLNTSGFPLLPLELILEILVYTSLPDALNFMSTCRQLRRLTYKETFSLILIRMVARGSLCWLRPCPLVVGEMENARHALATWIQDPEEGEDPFHNSDFPFPAFVHTCFVKSASMKSRRRIYGIVKQLEAQWAEQSKQDDCGCSIDKT
ncbi:hypothetical protein DL96DRAFT_1702093 [Flagelloscypha sp. PMI_526]|nr:hypothetical protein DL96DRAFT_1702093 [Flagelloscypha sp. PMI_526]